MCIYIYIVYLYRESHYIYIYSVCVWIHIMCVTRRERKRESSKGNHHCPSIVSPLPTGIHPPGVPIYAAPEKEVRREYPLTQPVYSVNRTRWQETQRRTWSVRISEPQVCRGVRADCVPLADPEMLRVGEGFQRHLGDEAGNTKQRWPPQWGTWNWCRAEWKQGLQSGVLLCCRPSIDAS